MRAYSLTELFCLTRAELFALHAEISSELNRVPPVVDRDLALDILRKIRRVLSARPAGPC